MRWQSLVSEDNKNISQGRVWLNLLLLLSCSIWLRDKDIPMGLGSIIGTFLMYNFGKKLKFIKDKGFVADEEETPKEKKASVLLSENNEAK